MPRIERATDMRLVREMLEEYARATHVDLSFQNLDHELDTLPYQYDPILVAWMDVRQTLLSVDAQTGVSVPQAAGCVALRRIDDETCVPLAMEKPPSSAFGTFSPANARAKDARFPHAVESPTSSCGFALRSHNRRCRESTLH